MALPDDVVELSPQRLQRRDLGIDIGQMLASDRIRLAAGSVLLVREAQQLADLIERESQLTGTADEAKPAKMVRFVAAIVA